LFAAVSGSSPSLYSPLGIDHAPISFFAQSGPPGWTKSKRSSLPALLYIKIPALFFFMAWPLRDCLSRHEGLQQHRPRHKGTGGAAKRCLKGPRPPPQGRSHQGRPKLVLTLLASGESEKSLAPHKGSADGGYLVISAQ